MANHFSILALRTPWTVWKGKKIWHCKMSPPSLRVSTMILGKSRGQLPIAPERMKQLGQSRNDTQLWMCLVVKVKSNAVKNNISYEPGMLGPWIKVNWMSRRQETARLNIYILGISDLKCMGMGEFNSDNHYIYYCGRESLRRKEVRNPHSQ